MTKDEFIAKKQELRKHHENELRKLNKEFALSNNKVKIGDIIEDHRTRIEVEIIDLFCGCSFPSCKYSGPRLKKDNTPYKSGEIDTIYQINL